MEDIKFYFDEIVESLDAFVYHYSIAEALAFKSHVGDAIVLNDFRHYCITKATKHLKATSILIDEGYGEDALILIRSAYECYISLSSSIHDPEIAIQSLVYDKIALYSGRAKYVQTKNGKIDFRSILRENSDTPTNSPPSLEKLVAQTGFEEDKDLHRQIYSFLSEHAHVHMMGSGNYRDDGKYITERDSQNVNAMMLGLYVSLMLLSLGLSIEDVEEIELERCNNDLKEGVQQLQEFISSEEFEFDIKGSLLNRLNKISANIKSNT